MSHSVSFSVHHINTKWTDHHVLLYEDLLKTFIECEIYFILFIIYLAFQKKKANEGEKSFRPCIRQHKHDKHRFVWKIHAFFPHPYIADVTMIMIPHNLKFV